jgi:hypothetical protein
MTNLIGKFVGGASLVLTTSGLAVAADLPSGLAFKAPIGAAIFDWPGLYIGNHVWIGHRQLWSEHESSSRAGNIFSPDAHGADRRVSGSL